MTMTERRKVIKGLEKCRRCECDDCTEKGASKAPFDCPAYDDFVDSAIVLLKEQEDLGTELMNAVELIHKKNERIEKLLKKQEAKWIEYPECLAYDGAYSDSHIVCSACKYVFDIMDNCTEEFHYCPHCGAKMEK